MKAHDDSMAEPGATRNALRTLVFITGGPGFGKSWLADKLAWKDQRVELDQFTDHDQPQPTFDSAAFISDVAKKVKVYKTVYCEGVLAPNACEPFISATRRYFNKVSILIPLPDETEWRRLMNLRADHLRHAGRMQIANAYMRVIGQESPLGMLSALLNSQWLRTIFQHFDLYATISVEHFNRPKTLDSQDLWHGVVINK